MTNLSHNIINVERDTRIHRVFPLLRVLQLLTTQQLALMRPSSWDDPFENLFMGAVAIDNGEGISLEAIRDSWYGQCWTLGPESDAMWRIYSGDKNGVLLTTTVGKLLDAVCPEPDQWSRIQFFVGAVQYLDESEITALVNATSFADLASGGSNDGFARTLLLKRKAFEHEREVRILFADAHKRETGPAALFRVDAPTLIDSVTLDPRLDPSMVPVIRQTLQSLGVTAQIEQSTLYRVPKLTIQLGGV